jgi:hypothetical protein
MAAIGRQRRAEHVSVETDTDATIEDTVFSLQSLLRSYNEDELYRPVSRQSVRSWSQWLAVLSCVISSHYLEMTCGQTEDFTCAAG